LTRLVEPKLQLPGAAATELRKAFAYRGLDRRGAVIRSRERAGTANERALCLLRPTDLYAMPSTAFRAALTVLP
jgi:hypothetical protein